MEAKKLITVGVGGAVIVGIAYYVWQKMSSSSTPAISTLPSAGVTTKTSTLPVVASVPVVAVQSTASGFAPSSAAYPAGLAENQVIKGQSTSSIWLLNGGKKWSLSYVWDNWGDPAFTTVEDSVIDSVPTGAGSYWTGAKPATLSFTSTNW